MERTILFVLLYVSVGGDIGKHVYKRVFHQSLTWTKAQDYCREHYTDLSYFNSQSEFDKLPNANGKIAVRWIHLQQDPNNKTAWKWSGGGHITYQNWADGEPNSDRIGVVRNNGAIGWKGKWFDNVGTNSSFYCVDVSVEEEKMSWEDALSHCRQKQTDLPSLLSETDRLLAQTQIKNQNVGERLWIGLRFLGDRWMWVNGDPLEYEAWSKQGGQDHQCPIRKRCGALTRDGLWENWDCGDKLNFICI